ncbi:MAG: DNA mismatch repair protein MutS, partial [Bacteroidia bacterium]|nr:DNA mismatch repair protein MutS [Bacteroidia bacterium]
MTAKITDIQTPLMKQYHGFKQKHPGALLLFRVGDFYETFGEDAITTSKILGIVLTKRGAGSPSEIELAGFPYHSLDSYLPKLVRAGQRVAICEQLEDPKQAKGIVKRGVTELVTPGVTYNDKVIETRHSNYLAAVYLGNENIGCSFLDISTGEFMVAQGNSGYIDKLLNGFKPSEIIVSKPQVKEFIRQFGDKYYHFAVDDWVFQHDYCQEKLLKHFGTVTLKGFGIHELSDAIVSAGSSLHYLEQNHHTNLQHITAISRIDEDKYVWFDAFTIRNLEVLKPSQPGGSALVDILDKTKTPMGSRLFKKWLVLPLKELALIKERLDTVEYFVKNRDLSNKLNDQLKLIGDLERIISKVSLQRANPREIMQLGRALEAVKVISALMESSNNPHILKLLDLLNPCHVLSEKLRKEMQSEVPLLIHKGGIFAEGVDTELDDLRHLAFKGKDYLVDIQIREQERTSIPSLKIAFNSVFGYYLEVTNTHKDKVPPEWIRKQTLTNAERYITEELKHYEEKILTAESRIHEIELRLYAELMAYLSDFIAPVQQNSHVIARLDCLLSFAGLAIENKYVKPEIN